jgi:hypothetical protein
LPENFPGSTSSEAEIRRKLGFPTAEAAALAAEADPLNPIVQVLAELALDPANIAFAGAPFARGVAAAGRGARGASRFATSTRFGRGVLGKAPSPGGVAPEVVPTTPTARGAGLTPALGAQRGGGFVGGESVSAGILPDAVRDSIVRVRQAVDEGIEVFRQRGREPTGLEGVSVGRRRGLDPDDVQEEIALEGLAERFGELEIQMRQRGVTLTREIEGEVQRAQESLARIGGRAKAAGTARRENTLLLDAIAERHGGRGIADITDILADVPEGFAGGRLGTRLLEDTEDPALAAAADRDADQVIKDTRRILFGEGGADLEARQTAGGPEALAKTAPTARGAGLTPDEAAARTVMSDLPDFNQTVDIAIRPDMWRRIANLPVIRRIQGRFNPSAVANNPIEQAFVGRAVLQHAGGTLTQRTMAPLGAIGSQEQAFGKLTPEGLIADGPLKGVTVNTVRSNPGAFAGKLTPAMDEWIRVADNIERAKLDFLKKNGIEIRELTFEEGGQYAGRRLWGRVDSENNVLAVAHVGAGPARVGAKLAAEQPRIFKTAEEAIAEGFRYIPDDEALFLNVQGAYNRVADERMANWLFDRVDWRTATVPEGIKVAREAAQRRLALANRSITAIQRAIRGETLPTGTVKAIERLFPQLEGRLREPTRVRIADVLKAAKTLEQPERVLEVPKIGAIRKVQKLLEAAEARLAQNPSNPALQREVSRLRSSLGFIRYRIALGEPLTLPHNVVKALRQDAIGDLRELLDAIRGTRTIRPGQRAPRFEGGLIEEVRREVAETLKKSAVARQRAISPRFDEGIVRAPAFAGKFFDAETARIINEMLDPGFSQALASVNQVNAVSRYFSLAGDASPFLIQLLYLAGGDYKAYAKAGRGFLKALTDPKFQDSYLALPESQAMLQKYPGYVLVKGGATEFTEAAGRGGLLSVERPILPEGEAAAKTAALLAPRVVGRVAGTVIKPFARGFEGAMDVAGLEMLKALDHLGTTPERIDDLAQFVNEFRGVTSSARLGLSPIQQQLETASLLAPRYNRAIAALLFDTVHGGLRGDLARKSLARGVGAVIAVGMAISYARGEREDEMLRHLNPADPTFMTWKIGNQNIGPGTKIRSVVRLFGQSARDPRALLDTSFGWGDLEYMRNPIIKFGRGLSSPVVSGAWDLLTGKDFIGEPTRDGLLSFTETIAKRFMFLWAHTALFEGGTPIDRLSRGLAEFAGLRAWPRNRILEVSDKWKPELKKYLDIDTDGPGISRSKYRERNPEVDAKLWIVGRVTSLKSGEASVIVQQLIANNDLDPNEIKAVKKDKERKKRLTAAGISLAPRSVEQRRVDRLIKALTANNERPGQ